MEVHRVPLAQSRAVCAYRRSLAPSTRAPCAPTQVRDAARASEVSLAAFREKFGDVPVHRARVSRFGFLTKPGALSKPGALHPLGPSPPTHAVGCSAHNAHRPRLIATGVSPEDLAKRFGGPIPPSSRRRRAAVPASVGLCTRT